MPRRTGSGLIVVWHHSSRTRTWPSMSLSFNGPRARCEECSSVSTPQAAEDHDSDGLWTGRGTRWSAALIVTIKTRGAWIGGEEWVPGNAVPSPWPTNRSGAPAWRGGRCLIVLSAPLKMRPQLAYLTPKQCQRFGRHPNWEPLMKKQSWWRVAWHGEKHQKEMLTSLGQMCLRELALLKRARSIPCGARSQ